MSHDTSEPSQTRFPSSLSRCRLEQVLAPCSGLLSRMMAGVQPRSDRWLVALLHPGPNALAEVYIDEP
jgi:hypothetical protein